jgi:hypothetical protein
LKKILALIVEGGNLENFGKEYLSSYRGNYGNHKVDLKI